MIEARFAPGSVREPRGNDLCTTLSPCAADRRDGDLTRLGRCAYRPDRRSFPALRGRPTTVSLREPSSILSLLWKTTTRPPPKVGSFPPTGSRRPRTTTQGRQISTGGKGQHSTGLDTRRDRCGRRRLGEGESGDTRDGPARPGRHGAVTSPPTVRRRCRPLPGAPPTPSRTPVRRRRDRAAPPGSLGRCDGGRCPWAVFACVGPEDRRRRPEALEGAVDAEEEFPQELRNRRDALKRAQGVARIVAGEHYGRPRHDEQRPPD